MSALKNRLKELRKAKNMTQDELVSELNSELNNNEKAISKMTISNWENNKHAIKPDKAQQLADFFSVSVGYLLGFVNDSSMESINTITKRNKEFLEEIEYAKNNDISELLKKSYGNINSFEFLKAISELVAIIKSKEGYSDSEIKEINYIDEELLSIIDTLYEQRLILGKINLND